MQDAVEDRGLTLPQATSGNAGHSALRHGSAACAVIRAGEPSLTGVCCCMPYLGKDRWIELTNE